MDCAIATNMISVGLDIQRLEPQVNLFLQDLSSRLSRNYA